MMFENCLLFYQSNYIFHRQYIKQFDLCEHFFRPNTSALTVFHSRISKRELYPENDTYVPLILKSLSSLPIVSVGKRFRLHSCSTNVIIIRYMIAECSLCAKKICITPVNNCMYILEQKEGGTQLKLIIEYLNGDKALMKPMR